MCALSRVMEDSITCNREDKNSGPDDDQLRARPAGAQLQCNGCESGRADEAREAEWNAGISQCV
jgi:hypothetical protein